MRRRMAGGSEAQPALPLETEPAAAPGMDPGTLWGTTESGRPLFDDDLHPPNVEKVLVQLGPRFVVEKSDPHNWTLMERRKVESGEHQGRFSWKVLGYHGSPGQAARKAVQLGALQDLGPGLHSLEALVAKLSELERGVREEVEKTLREEGIRKALEVVKDEGDRARILVLLGVKKRRGGGVACEAPPKALVEGRSDVAPDSASSSRC